MKENIKQIGFGVLGCGVLAVVGGLILKYKNETQQSETPVDENVVNYEDTNEIIEESNENVGA